MTQAKSPSVFFRSETGAVALSVASVLFSLGFACAVPLAAFAALAAMSFGRRAALATTGGVWIANQAWGFAFLHYPLDRETVAWGVALGVIALLACDGARLATRRFSGAFGAFMAFLCSFAVYEGALVAIDLITNQSADAYAPATVARIFLINACAFGALWALKTVLANTVADRAFAALAPRRI